MKKTHTYGLLTHIATLTVANKHQTAEGWRRDLMRKQKSPASK